MKLCYENLNSIHAPFRIVGSPVTPYTTVLANAVRGLERVIRGIYAVFILYGLG
jgi:hypothetical protein